MGKESTGVRAFGQAGLVAGCGALSCDSCYPTDRKLETALAPAPEPRSSRQASVRQTGGHLAVVDALAAQDEVFGSSLPCY